MIAQKKITINQTVLYASIVEDTITLEKRIVASIHDSKIGLISHFGSMDLKIVDPKFVVTSIEEAKALLYSVYKRLEDEASRREKEIKSIKSLQSSALEVLNEVQGWIYDYKSIEDIPDCYAIPKLK